MARKHAPSKRLQSGSSALAERQPGTLQSFMERMDRFFENPWELLGPSLQAFEPRIELEQRPNEIVVSARLPGYRRDDISVDLTEDSVTLRGRRAILKESRKGGGYQESSEQSFVRSIMLPAAVKAGEAEASFKRERLEIRLPRAKQAQVQRLDIRP